MATKNETTKKWEELLAQAKEALGNATALSTDYKKLLTQTQAIEVKLKEMK